MLKEARFDDDIRVEATVLRLTSMGTIAENRVTAWHAVRKQIQERASGLVPMVDQVQVRSSTPARASTAGGPAAPNDPLNLELQGVSSTPPFITLRNGQSYFPGAQLPNGYTLVAVQAGQLILQKETERISLNLEDMTWQQQNP